MTPVTNLWPSCTPDRIAIRRWESGVKRAEAKNTRKRPWCSRKSALRWYPSEWRRCGGCHPISPRWRWAFSNRQQVNENVREITAVYRYVSIARQSQVVLPGIRELGFPGFPRENHNPQSMLEANLVSAPALTKLKHEMPATGDAHLRGSKRGLETIRAFIPEASSPPVNPLCIHRSCARCSTADSSYSHILIVNSHRSAISYYLHF